MSSQELSIILIDIGHTSALWFSNQMYLSFHAHVDIDGRWDEILCNDGKMRAFRNTYGYFKRITKL